MNHRIIAIEAVAGIAVAAAAMTGSFFVKQQPQHIESPAANVPAEAQGEGATVGAPQSVPLEEPILFYTQDEGEEFPTKKLNNAYGW